MATNSTLAGVPVGDSYPVRIMGVINVSPESFFKGSVKDKASIGQAARKMEEEGADFIDVGAMSTAPYLNTQISEQEEAERLSWAVRHIRKTCDLPISVDTSRARAAHAGLTSGARILNDISGLRRDNRMLSLLPKTKGLILMAYPPAAKKVANALAEIKRLLRESLAKTVGRISANKIVIDPGIGFFREQGMPWWKWDAVVLRNLYQLKTLKRPLLIGVSRKSFIGNLTGEKAPEKRLYGSLAATALAIQNGARLIRTHDVLATKEAIKVTEGILSFGTK